MLPLNRPHWSRFESGACRLTFPCQPSAVSYTARVQMHLSVDGEGADWVTEPKGAIKKANLTFVAKFLWLLVLHCLSPHSC